MITPAQIRQKAVRLYKPFLKAWLAGEEFFPKRIPSDTKLSGDLTTDRLAIQQLRDDSKENRGFGYRIEFKRKRSKQAFGGRNDLPDQIWLDSAPDLLKLIGRTDEFRRLQATVGRIRQELPRLETWLAQNIVSASGLADHVDGLIAVVQWFQKHPLPDCYAREIPVPVHGKFVEENSGVLQQWLEVEGILPAGAIRVTEDQFFRRFGLRHKEPLVSVRCLSTEVQSRLQVPTAEVSLPAEYISSVDLTGVKVFVVENLLNVRTFPAVPGGLVVAGGGKAAVNLYSIFGSSPASVFYWGDLDPSGYQILSQFRQRVSAAESLLMDEDCLQQHLHFATAASYPSSSAPSLLNPSELAAWRRCQQEGLQLEQERIPQPAIVAELERRKLL
ncbi:MAG: DUF3322 and DUF2220 domain-containing protein [Fuerstiella sp.]